MISKQILFGLSLLYTAVMLLSIFYTSTKINVGMKKEKGINNEGKDHEQKL
jgi:hypothetical protein